MNHTFHIPVLGLEFSIDTPLKVARYGLSSVVSIVDDELIERMRKFHSVRNDVTFTAIHKSEPDYRARRITAYLNLLNKLVNDQFENLRNLPFNQNNDLDRYFSLLPESSQLKHSYELMTEHYAGNQIFQNILRSHIKKGAIDVNIMAKVDKLNFNAMGKYAGDENTDALAGLRGFANSDLESSLVLSAGINPRLYSYLETFPDFYPDQQGRIQKKIILKVSDYRSAFIQAKFLAKKGLWVSEFRIESGLNCGGHAFATDGLLLGPILEEFKVKRAEMLVELRMMCQAVSMEKKMDHFGELGQRITVQGGIGTAGEDRFLIEHYKLESTGWGSPFLLVPEATNVDEATLQQLAGAEQQDFYLSAASPLGILFNNFKKSSSEQQRLKRIEQGRPGSPCIKKYLCTNTEFTGQPICTASREYQQLKLTQLKSQSITNEEYKDQVEKVTEKICLCEGLCASAYIKNDILRPRESTAVAICPGPNLAYFNRTFSLDEMVGHIYGRIDLLEHTKRPNMFINELNLYIDYLKKDLAIHGNNLNEKKGKYFIKFKEQLQLGIGYYKMLIPEMTCYTVAYLENVIGELLQSEKKLCSINII